MKTLLLVSIKKGRRPQTIMKGGSRDCWPGRHAGSIDKGAAYGTAETYHLGDTVKGTIHIYPTDNKSWQCAPESPT